MDGEATAGLEEGGGERERKKRREEGKGRGGRVEGVVRLLLTQWPDSEVANHFVFLVVPLGSHPSFLACSTFGFVVMLIEILTAAPVKSPASCVNCQHSIGVTASFQLFRLPCSSSFLALG